MFLSKDGGGKEGKRQPNSKNTAETAAMADLRTAYQT